LRSVTGELSSQFGGRQYRFISDAGAFYVSRRHILHDRFEGSASRISGGDCAEVFAAARQ
jgi:hypothetical protein